MKSRWSYFSEIYWPLLAVVAMIAMLGAYNLHSASIRVDAYLYRTQLMWFAMGLVVLFLTMTKDYRLTESIAYVAYAVVCGLLLLVLLKGRSAMGARRWLDVAGFIFQPSELAKLSTIFCMARYFSQRILTEGYSVYGLFRPLNPSRPLALLLVLVLCWHRPLLVDPLGILSRSLYERSPEPPSLEALWWFKALLLTLLAMSYLLAMVSVVRFEKRASLLHPWALHRKKYTMLGLSLVLLLIAGLFFRYWQHPFLCDPLGLLLTALYQRGHYLTHHEVLLSGWWWRGFLLLGILGYLALSFWDIASRCYEDIWIAPLDLLLLPFVLVLVEPDLGSAGILALIGVSMILVVGVQWRSLLILTISSGLIAMVAWFGILKDYQKRRILTFIDPEQDLKGAGWNAVQSLIAVGSGRWLGTGHRGGSQTQLSFLPEQHTDFAFSVWAEEQGFLGCALLLLLYLGLILLALHVAMEARDTYGALLATGITALILWQAFINVGMVIGMLPVVGITLPLFSYGGSSMLTVMLGIGLLMNVYSRRKMHTSSL